MILIYLQVTYDITVSSQVKFIYRNI